MIRGRVLQGVTRMLESLRIMVGSYQPDEIEVLTCLEKPKQFDLSVDIANFIMVKLGHESHPKEPRFDKTRRTLSRTTNKSLRGERLAGAPTEADAHDP